jgi:hypothetical protein
VDRGIALSFRDLGARRVWVVSTTPRPLYPREISGNHCTGDWVGPRAGLDVCEKSHPHRDFLILFSFILRSINPQQSNKQDIEHVEQQYIMYEIITICGIKQKYDSMSGT